MTFLNLTFVWIFNDILKYGKEIIAVDNKMLMSSNKNYFVVLKFFTCICLAVIHLIKYFISQKFFCHLTKITFYIAIYPLWKNRNCANCFRKNHSKRCSFLSHGKVFQTKVTRKNNPDDVDQTKLSVKNVAPTFPS